MLSCVDLLFPWLGNLPYLTPFSKSSQLGLFWAAPLSADLEWALLARTLARFDAGVGIASWSGLSSVSPRQLEKLYT